jgi:Protein of unknown function (DUF2505)
VATSLTWTQQYPADSARVRAMLTDPDFVSQRAQRTGASASISQVTVAADGVETVVSERTLPADVPAFAKKFMGETLVVTETQTWPVLDASGNGTVSIRVEFSAPIVFTGSMVVTNQTDTTMLDISGQFKASVPLFGGKVEEIAKAQTERYLAKEQQLGQAWLTAHP